MVSGSRAHAKMVATGEGRSGWGLVGLWGAGDTCRELCSKFSHAVVRGGVV
jgi:hypothetical protein